jgi:hypothetical protein
LLLLEEIAVRDGRAADAIALREEIRKAGADTTHQVLRDFMFRCLQHPAPNDWLAAARQDLRALEQAGKVLSPWASQADCAKGAFEAVLNSDTASLRLRWGALVGVQSLMVATANDREVPKALGSKNADGLPVWALYALDVMAGAKLHDQAVRAVEVRGRDYPAMSAAQLYVLAAWAAYQGDSDRLHTIGRELRRKADSSRSRSDSLLVRAVGARIPLLAGDTVEAVRLLQQLSPTAAREDIAWQLWESLGAERLLLAQILYARGRFDEAIRVANSLDAPEPIAYLIYLRPSLELRIKAEKQLGRNAQATTLEQRLRMLAFTK